MTKSKPYIAPPVHFDGTFSANIGAGDTFDFAKARLTDWAEIDRREREAQFEWWLSRMG